MIGWWKQLVSYSWLFFLHHWLVVAFVPDFLSCTASLHVLSQRTKECRGMEPTALTDGKTNETLPLTVQEAFE